jgi:molybdopterin molybdotransferase
MYDERLKLIAQLDPILKMERIPTARALHRTLMQEVLAETDMPPFDKSAMDGYACRMVDLGNEMKVLETIPAGHLPARELGPNECSKIMTGAAVPLNADCVFKVEDSMEVKKGWVKCTNLDSKRNICYLGEDYSRGELLLAKGQILGPEHIAVISGAGLKVVFVSKKPAVGLIVTGSELLEPGEPLVNGKIRNSNANQMISLLDKMGLDVNYYGIVEDDYKVLKNKIFRALEQNDVLLLTGGASMGDFDFVPELLKNELFEIFWERTGLKPGNPMTFARKGDKYFLGLSGNPVSSMVQFEFLAKPILYRLSGANYQPFRFQAELAEDFNRRNADRVAVVPVKLNPEGAFEKVAFNGSAHISGLAGGTALLEIPVGTRNLKKGDKAYVRPL